MAGRAEGASRGGFIGGGVQRSGIRFGVPAELLVGDVVLESDLQLKALLLFFLPLSGPYLPALLCSRPSRVGLSKLKFRNENILARSRLS